MSEAALRQLPKAVPVSENSLLSFLTARELDVVSILHVGTELFTDEMLALHRAQKACNAPVPQ